jgi:glycosyltransferase involved in cell wall biosynthesis
LRWDIGLAPLRATPFNIVKADTKWVDYTSIGAAVVASANTAYDRCCAEGCGMLVSGDDGWRAALQALIDNPDQRFAMVEAAQSRLVRDYSRDALTRQVLDMFALATQQSIEERRRPDQPSEEGTQPRMSSGVPGTY